MISQPLIYIVCNCTALCPTKGLRRRQLYKTMKHNKTIEIVFLKNES
jgi:hypothetical protein